MINKKPTFEESIGVINEQIEKRRSKWNVSVYHIDFDDIKQMLLIHIFEKWEQFDPNKGELSHWVSKICSAQIKNHWRNLLGNTVSPCEICAANEGGDRCRIYGTKDSFRCKLLNKWEATKKQKYNLKLAANIEDFNNTLYYFNSDIKNYPEILKKITNLIKDYLTRKQYKIYTLLYVENMSEEDVGKALGYKSSGGRRAGYASILQNKKIILAKIKELIKDHDIV